MILVMPARRVLFVAPQPHLAERLGHRLDVRTADDHAEALDLLQRDPGGYGVVIWPTPGPVLAESRRVAPRVARVALAGHADTAAAEQAVADGLAARVVSTPCSALDLIWACNAALAQHAVPAARGVAVPTSLPGSPERVRAVALQLAERLGVADIQPIAAAAAVVHGGAADITDAGVREILARLPRRRHEQDEEAPPVATQILRVALDVDRLEARLGSRDAAVSAVRARSRSHEPRLLAALAA